MQLKVTVREWKRMRQRIEKKEIRPSQPSVTVMFYDRTGVLGRLGSFRLGRSAASSLSATAKVWAENVPAQPSFSVRMTETLETGDSFRNLASLSLSHLKKVSTEAPLTSSALPACERAVNLGHDTVACKQNIQESEQRRCFAA